MEDRAIALPGRAPRRRVGRVEDVWFQVRRGAWRLRFQLAYQWPRKRAPYSRWIVTRLLIEPADPSEASFPFAVTAEQLQQHVGQRLNRVPVEGITTSVLRTLDLAVEATAA